MLYDARSRGGESFPSTRTHASDGFPLLADLTFNQEYISGKLPQARSRYLRHWQRWCGPFFL